MTTRTWTKADIKDLLVKSDMAVERAMLALYKLQTTDERRDADTKYDNDMGFNCFNAVTGTKFARFLQGMDDRGNVRFEPKSLRHPLANRVFGRYLKPGQTAMDRARAIALLHSGQLVDVANGKLVVPG